MSYMRFCVLDVGQGSANYIELREDDDTLTAAAIVDVGSEQWKRIAGKPSAAWLSEQLADMTGGAALDVIVLSHSDSDHVNLIPSVLENFDTPRATNPTKPVLQIRNVVFGGDYGRYAKGRQRNFLARLDDFRPLNKNPGACRIELDDDWSSFDGDETDWEPLATVGGEIELWALTANTTAESLPDAGPSKKRKRATLPDGFGINTRSIVVAAIFANRVIVATGDATGLTLAHCNGQLEKAAVHTKLTRAFMVTVPHHGSDTTLYDLTGSSSSDKEAAAVVEKFVEKLDADTISASAGERKTFRHPAARVIYDFGKRTLLNPKYIDPALKAYEQHFYTAYFMNRTFTLAGGVSANWPAIFDWWYTARTKRNVYTTDYFAEAASVAIPTAYPYEAVLGKVTKFAPEPPRGISWAFIVEDGGTTRLEVARMREVGAAQHYWAAVEAVHGPLPESGLVWVPSAPLPDEPDTKPSPDEPPPPGLPPVGEPPAAGPPWGGARRLDQPPEAGPPDLPPRDEPPPRPPAPRRLRQIP